MRFSSSTDTIGKAAFLRFARIASLAVQAVEAHPSAVVAALAVASAAVVASKLEGMVVVAALAAAFKVVAVDLAVALEVAVVDTVEAAMEDHQVAPEVTVVAAPQLLPLLPHPHRTPSPTTRLLATTRARSSSSAT